MRLSVLSVQSVVKGFWLRPAACVFRSWKRFSLLPLSNGVCLAVDQAPGIVMEPEADRVQFCWPRGGRRGPRAGTPWELG